ncbi:MAG TPA: hypothetical protein VFO70_07830, partial [Chitinophagaceae bacterium]|nr:hypothetical protein [Chitinophagaceae bacterium]
TLQERKQKIAYKAFLLQSLKKVAVVLAIVGAGVLIGFTLKSNAGKKQLALNQSTTAALNQPAQQQAETLEEVKIDQDAGLVNKEMQDDLLVQSKESSGPLTRTNKEFDFQPQTKPVPENNRLPRKEIISDSQEEEHYEQPASSVEVDASTGERKRTLRNSNEPVSTKTSRKANSESSSEPVAVMNKSLSRFVTVKSNDYKIVAFGGIRDLRLTVRNDSKYELDNVMVELQYLKPSLQPLKTENIQFNSIPAGESQTVRVPDTNRGIKVKYRIVKLGTASGE